jgi:hypothetical protein
MIYVGGRYVVTATGQFAYRPLAIAALALPRTSSPPALNEQCLKLVDEREGRTFPVIE